MNAVLTRRIEYLVLTVSNGQDLPLTATTRKSAEARRLLQQVRSYQAAGTRTGLAPIGAPALR